MAAGDGFANLLEADDPTYKPPDEVAPTGSEGGPGSLSEDIATGKQVAAASKVKGFAGFDRPLQAQELMHSGEEAQALQANDARRHTLAEKERASINLGEAAARQDDLRRAEFGTADPLKAAQLKATGVFDADFGERFKADPEGSAAAAARALSILGKGGMQDAPTGPSGPEALTGGRKYSVGTGQHGEPYFTNLSPSELKEEAHQRSALTGESYQPSVTDLHRIPGMQDQPAGAPGTSSTDPADILFQGKLTKVQEIIGQPARDIKQLEAKQDLKNRMIQVGHDQGLDAARSQLVDEMRKNPLLGIAAFKDADNTLLKYGQHTAREIKNKHLDPTLYFPSQKANVVPGTDANPAEQASVTNPGGRLNDTTFQQEQQQHVANQTTQQIDQAAAKEQPTTAQYARGGVKSVAPTQLDPGDPTAGAGPRSDLGILGGLIKEKLKRKQREADARGYDPNAQSDIAKLFGF